MKKNTTTYAYVSEGIREYISFTNTFPKLYPLLCAIKVYKIPKLIIIIYPASVKPIHKIKITKKITPSSLTSLRKPGK